MQKTNESRQAKVGQTLGVNVAKKSTRAKSPARRDSAPVNDSATFAKELLSIKRTPPNLVASKRSFWAQDAFQKNESSTSKQPESQSKTNKEKPVAGESKGIVASKSVK